MKLIRTLMSAAALVAAVAGAGSAHASLTTFQTFTGQYAVSTDGFGSISQAGVISASVPAGSTVVAAYLYTSTNNNASMVGVGATLAGQNVGSFTNLGTVVRPIPNFLQLTAGRTDVTSIIKPLIDGGVGGTYNFAVTETNGNQDGEALVVVYSNGALSNGTVGILDGFSFFGGDSTSINFSAPLDPTAPGFFAEMRLGIGFSCCGQKSTVTVNGTTISTTAGNNDDGAQTVDGSLITVGGFDDPFSALLPAYEDDHERYNLVPYIANGSTSISVRTSNATQDDNIFLAVFHVAGDAVFVDPNRTPEPMSLMLAGLALAGLGLQRRAAKRA